jgi:hypothetical protein
MILEPMPGAPLVATGRRARAAAPAAVHAACARLAAWDAALAPRDPPPRGTLRDGLLEDPTAPVEWIIDGLGRCARLGLLAADAAACARAAIEADPRVAFSHGDLLPRHIFVDGARVSFVDWECAGAHAHAWDAALLAANLPPAARPAAHGRTYLATLVFALARELKFRRGRPAPDVAADLAAVARELMEISG